MSGVEVIGGISAIITIIDASIKIYNGARKDMKLSKTFENVGRRLPIILHTLQICKKDIEPSKDSMSADVCEALEKIIDACDEKAGKLREIFEKVMPGEKDAWEKRYQKVIKRLGKGNKVEELMLSITQDVQLIVNNHAVKSAKPEQNFELENIIKEMKSLKSSVPEEESSDYTFNSSGGPMTNNLLRDNAQQINNAAAVGTQNFVTHKQKDDFSFRGPVGVCLSQAPYIDPELFVGRNTELNEIKEALEPGDKSQGQRRLVLGGVGGMGKTQLAIAYANCYCGIYTSVFWLNAATEAILKDSFRSMAELIFDIQEPGVLEAKQIVIYVHRWLSDMKNTRWLLIFDNYDDPDQLQIKQYYPPASHGAIVVTTRRPDLVAGRTVPIQPLKDIEESLTILQTRSKRENVKSDPYAQRLAERLGGLPLALATAGAYLRQSSLTFERYLQEYEKRWNIDPRRPPRLQEYDRTLYTTWDLSYTALESDDPDAAKLLKLLAYFDSQSISYKLLRAGLTDGSPRWLSADGAKIVEHACLRTRLDVGGTQ
ncbi:uncharacterized protein GIQ15_01655 [Arthroderma uncinatum]|uniref:uncharacterized protein n=1 Tax=Arthroderma uncinatum TaxID=74035 RepID=UPI00144AA98B|nr:uncharacterized protein GIQ15_01655 [Arthroderma uncinatum]KAF3492138.1 hypothetical protein GIQ15_01655 [Arthroderma uncinatum]